VGCTEKVLEERDDAERRERNEVDEKHSRHGKIQDGMTTALVHLENDIGGSVASKGLG